MKVYKDVLIQWVLILIIFFIAVIRINDYSLIAYIGILLLSMGIFASTGKANLLSTITLFYIMYLYFVALGPLGYYCQHKKCPEYLEKMILLSLFLFVLGYFSISVFARQKNILKSNTWFTINYKRSQNLVKICIVIIYLALPFKMAYIIMNAAYLFSGSLGEGRMLALSGNGLLIRLANLWVIAFFILFELQEKKYIISKTAYIGIGLCVVLELFMGGRTNLMMIALVCLLMKYKKKHIKLGRVLKFGLLAILFLVVYKSYRDGFHSPFSTGDILFNAILNEPYVGCINIGYLIDAFPKKHPFFNGYSYLINFIMLLPGPDLDFTLTLKQII